MIRLSATLWAFPVAMWASSRLLVVAAMLMAGEPLGWGLLVRWDGGWYAAIATTGYEYAPDGAQHSVAFFPLFPLFAGAGMALGLPFAAAAAIVANLGFLAALLALHGWTRARYGPAVARWATALLAWCPYSLFAAIAYSEGLFLALTTGALWAFDRGRFGVAALLGALATATRVTALPLAPAMLWAAWRDRRPGAALAGLATTTGFLAYMAYLGWRFGDPLVFLHAQSGWRESVGFDWRGWAAVLTLGLAGPMPWNGLHKALMVLGGGWLLVKERRALPPIALAFGLGGLALILASGSLTSIDRYAFGLAPLAMALGLLLARHPRWGTGVLLYFAVLLASYAGRMAKGLWVA